MSPCVYELALHQPAPVIHYMHNYRSGCLNGVFYRDGAPCFSCQGGNYFPGIMHACWRKNAAYSSLAAAVLYKTRRMGAWSRFSSYIAISRRQRELLIRTGIPEDKIRVIPHFIRQNPAPAAGQPRRDVLYAGRLTQEKESCNWFRRGNSYPPRPHSLPDGRRPPARRTGALYLFPPS